MCVTAHTSTCSHTHTQHKYKHTQANTHTHTHERGRTHALLEHTNAHLHFLSRTHNHGKDYIFVGLSWKNERKGKQKVEARKKTETNRNHYSFLESWSCISISFSYCKRRDHHFLSRHVLPPDQCPLPPLKGPTPAF